MSVYVVVLVERKDNVVDFRVLRGRAGCAEDLRRFEEG